VRIYLQLGAVFVVFFTLVDLAKVLAENGGEFRDVASGMAKEMAETFVIIYAFASPVGATLTTHLLLHRTDITLWILSGITVVAMAVGIWS
jgi:nucleoside phosphorylase